MFGFDGKNLNRTPAVFENGESIPVLVKIAICFFVGAVILAIVLIILEAKWEARMHCKSFGAVPAINTKCAKPQ